MDIIKFRGKIEDNWWYVTPDDDSWEQFWALVDRKTVGQFIGVFDARNAEIYEGDIVRYDGLGQEPIGYIERFYATWIIKGGDAVNLTTSSSLFEVCTNIHDHPDIIKHK
jgi:hypothetical protein